MGSGGETERLVVVMPKMGICECGNEFVAMNRKRRLCAECQIVRDLTFCIMRRHCQQCGEAFWPSRVSYRRCPDCVEPPNPDRHAACVRCEEHRRPAPGLSKTCISCVMASREVARSYLITLAKARVTRIAEHRATMITSTQ